MTVLCYGDSNTFGYDPRSFLGDRYELPWPEALAELTGWQVRNEGSCGRRVPVRGTVAPNDANCILVMLGTNDLLNGDDPRSIAKRMERFLSNLDRCKTVLIAPPHLCRGEWVTGDNLILRSKSLAGAYQAVAEELSIRFLDALEWSIPLCYDGVHFTEEGHRLFAAQIARSLQSGCCFLTDADV